MENEFENEKIQLKLIIFICVAITSLFTLYTKYEKYRDIKDNQDILNRNIEELDTKLVELNKEREKQREKLQRDYNEWQILMKKMEILTIKNESEFKKMIYILLRESGLKLEENSKSEKIWEKNGYTLKYIHFNVYGSLNNFGKFLFFINKSKKYIDTSKMYIELKEDGFKISLGLIEKIEMGR